MICYWSSSAFDIWCCFLTFFFFFYMFWQLDIYDGKAAGEGMLILRVPMSTLSQFGSDKNSCSLYVVD